MTPEKITYIVFINLTAIYFFIPSIFLSDFDTLQVIIKAFWIIGTIILDIYELLKYK